MEETSKKNYIKCLKNCIARIDKELEGEYQYINWYSNLRNDRAMLVAILNYFEKN